jgi:hypothetical protein
LHAAELAGPRDVDVTDRRRLCHGMRPHTNRRETVDGGARQRQVALVVTGLLADAWRSRLDHDGVHTCGIERNSKAGAHQAAANDKDRLPSGILKCCGLGRWWSHGAE